MNMRWESVLLLLLATIQVTLGWNVEYGGFALETDSDVPTADPTPLEQSTFKWYWETVQDYKQSWASWYTPSAPSTVEKSVKTQFHGHQVWNVSLSAQQYPLFMAWTEKHPQLIDIWKQYPSHVTFRVAPSAQSFVERFLNSLDLTFTLIVKDVEVLIQDQIHQHQDPLQFQQANKWPTVKGFHEKYHTITEIQDFLTEKISAFPNITQPVVVGKTYEGRDIQGIRIGVPSVKPKQHIVFHGGIHAREWIGPATMLYLVDHLLSSYEQQDPVIQEMLTLFDWTIIPVLNVDGYIFTHESNRMWRKNRQPNKLPWCIGTDSNRNFGYKWNQGGASSNPCSEAYAGSKPFSSPEAQAISQFLLDLKNVLIYIDFHAYSQLWMYPFGATCDELPADVEKLDQAGKAASLALEKVHGMSFSVGSICNIIYQASGSSIDWAYSVANITYAYGVELRDTGRYGFLLPPQQIIPSGEEVFAGVQALVNKVIQLEHIK